MAKEDSQLATNLRQQASKICTVGAVVCSFVACTVPTAIAVPGKETSQKSVQKQPSVTDPRKAAAVNHFITLGSRLSAKDDNEAAVKAFDQAISIDPNCAAAYAQRGKSELWIDRYDQAASDFAKAISLGAIDHQNYYLLACAHGALKHYPQTVDAYTKALAIDPKNKLSLEMRAKTYAQMGKYQESANDWTHYLSLHQGSDRALYELASVHHKAGQLDKSLAVYNKLIALYPDEEDAFRFRGDIYFQTGQYAKAVDDYTKAIKLGGVVCYDSRAKALDKLGKHGQADADRKAAESERSAGLKF